MADDDIKFSFSGKEPRIDKESHEQSYIEMSEKKVRKSKKNKETK